MRVFFLSDKIRLGTNINTRALAERRAVKTIARRWPSARISRIDHRCRYTRSEEGLHKLTSRVVACDTRAIQGYQGSLQAVVAHSQGPL